MTFSGSGVQLVQGAVAVAERGIRGLFRDLCVEARGGACKGHSLTLLLLQS